jgi:hypothetical protein
MSRSDSGYHSNLSNRPGYYGDPSSVLPEEDDYPCDDNTMTWPYQYNMDAVEATYDQQQLSNYMVEGTGSHMAGYYPDTPRTTTHFDPSQDMDLDDDNGPYLEEEGTSHWPTHLDTLSPSQYQHASYHDHAGPSTISPTHDDGASTYFDNISSAPPTVPSSSTPTTRRRLPSKQFSKASSSTIPPAPVNDHHPHHLKSPQVASSPSTTATTTTTNNNKFPCLMPSCNKQFNRAADLDRHMKFIHCKATVRAMLCDYRRCPRHKNPFHRADHFRDHLRDQHKEDLLKRGETTSPDAKWWRERAPGAVYGGWWRCSKCFVRVAVEKDGWQCGSCGNYCEGERQGTRKLPRVCEYLECQTRQCRHAECAGEKGGEWHGPAKFREHLRNAHGEDVPVKEGKEGEKELESEEWCKGRSGEAVFNPVWRCTRCLDAVDSREDGFVCGGCGFGCEELRKGWHGDV